MTPSQRGLAFAMCLISALLLAWPSSSQAFAHGPQVALLIAHNRAGNRAKTLRYAVSDALKFRKVLLQVSGYRKQNIFLSLNRSATQVQKTFGRVKQHIETLRKAHPNKKIVLLVYYSGHARNGHFFLGSTSLSFTTLRRFLKRSGATLRLALLDTCGSGRFLETRGIKRHKKGFHIPFLNTHSARGEAIITSTGDRENAYEDLKLRGGIFTHYVTTGLRGAADRNRDGQVTLEELYAFVYNRTINRTVFAHAGPQKPHFQTNIRGTGQVVLSKLHQDLAKLHFRQKLKGQFFIWDQKKTLYAGFRKKAHQAVRLAMRPGHYHIQWRHGKRVFSSTVKLNKNQIFYLGRKQGRLAYFRALSRRGGTTTEPQISDFSWIPSENPTPHMSLSWTAGANGISLLGGPVSGGGRFGFESRFLSAQVGIWGFSKDFAAIDNRQTLTSLQLLIDVQLAAGYRFRWSNFSVFMGAYGGLGWAIQHANVQPRLGLLLLAGVQIAPTYWFLPRLGITLPLQIGVEAGQIVDAWKAQLTWSITAGLSYRL